MPLANRSSAPTDVGAMSSGGVAPLPLQEPVNSQPVVNLNAAKSLGLVVLVVLVVPPIMQQRADKVIE